MSTPALSAPARRISEQGFAVFEDAYSPDEVEFLRSRLVAKYDELGRPRTHANPPLEPAPDVEISQVGLIFHKLGRYFPEFGPRLLKPSYVQVLRELLGADMHLEYTAAVLCNDARSFFPWHAHVGGVDNVVYRKQKIFPSFERSERVTILIYLDDLTDEAGTLLVQPRNVRDDTHAPFDPTLEDWDGQVELHCRRGTVVLLEQCTWHAARGKCSPGVRAFIAGYFASERAPRTSWVDESFKPWAEAGSLLASLLPSPERHVEGPSGDHR